MGKDQDLLQAVKDSDLATIHKLLNKQNKNKTKIIGSHKKLNVNYQNNDGMSALHQAALVGNTEILLALLEGGAHVDLMDSKGMRPLHYAAWQGKDEPVKLLLQFGSSATDPAYDGETPLHLACQHGHFQVVNILLCYHAEPTIRNKEFRTPLDLGCEFGHYKVVELLLSSNLCNWLLQDSPDDMLDNNRTTCLHLAAKNGHAEIIRLLLHAGVNINRETLQGTALHEAALCGKIDIVKVLLENGIDINRANSYDQTALDIVNRFTASRAAKELKQILKQASNAITVRALEGYFDQYDPDALSFQAGDYIQVLEQHQDGIWKGYVLSTSAGYQSVKSGYFPSSAVQVLEPDALSRQNSPMKQGTIRKGSAPGVFSHAPGASPPPGGISSHYTSVGYDESFPPPPSPLAQKSPHRQDSFSYDAPPYSPGQHIGQPLISYASGNHSPSPLDHPEWSRYADAGEYRSGSPCRDSPTGSNRNSAASTDSGRGGSAAMFDSRVLHNYVNVQIAQHRLSGQSYESGVSSRQSYHSNSSSSLGSLDRLEESGYSSQVNVAELVQQGMAQDTEIIHAWLADLHYDEYYNNFVGNGYDMGTISRMTPEDLTAIGITKPGHRKRLKSEIARLHIPDGIPDHKPADLGEWLRLLNLDQYYETLTKQNYSMDNVTEITWEDLEEIGITKLGHQKKTLLAIDRLKKLAAGAKRASITMNERRGSSDLLHNGPKIQHTLPQYNNTRWSAEMANHQSQLSHEVTIATIQPRKSPSGDSINSAPEMKTFLPMDECRGSFEMLHQQRTKRLGSVERAVIESHSQPGSGDVTPTNERSSTPDSLDGRRPSAVVNPRMNGSIPNNKQKPVAMIVAKTRRSSRDVAPEIIPIDDVEKSSENDSSSDMKDHIYDKPEGSDAPSSPQGVVNSANESFYALAQLKSNSKRIPPPTPPKRINSFRSESSENVTDEELGSSPPPPPLPPPLVMRDAMENSQTFTGCIKSLSEKFCRREGSDRIPFTTQNLNQSTEEFPPPPSPLLGNNRESTLTTNTSVSKPGVAKPQEPPKVEPKPKLTPLIESNLHKAIKNELSMKSTSEIKQSDNSVISPSKESLKMNNFIKSPRKEPLKVSDSILKSPNREAAKPKDSPIASEPSAKVESLPQVKPKPFTNNQPLKVMPPVVPKGNDNDSSGGSDIEDGNATVRRVSKVKRNESTTSLDSNVSTDSNTLPFANENVGTIKQRNPANKPSIVPLDIDDDSWEETATMKRRPSNHQQADSRGAEKSVSQRAANATAGFPDTLEDAMKVTKSKGPESGNVLNDIGNMLQDLTDELDAMLEFECNA
ncbi:uncharacterized protein LOC141904707 isoform X3 [Tubulanus polymorphus]|uniref:uncharacterized protein LOC141904707 isoform X3 n=1 Tax=Tubulanus polymorphus TaxID=672921 RepID=UPI003DA3DAB5